MADSIIEPRHSKPIPIVIKHKSMLLQHNSKLIAITHISTPEGDCLELLMNTDASLEP